MREFGVAFIEGLRRGLRPFPNPKPGEELLVECFNLMPTENFPVAHEELTAVGMTTVFANYFAIKDQAGVIWYWVAGQGLDLAVFSSIPDLIAAGFDVVDLTPVTVPYWIQVDAYDVPATQMYIWPATFSGDATVFTTPPAVGTGYDAGVGLDFRSLSGFLHRLGALTSLDHLWRVV